MSLRVLLLAALAIWGMAWSKDANAVINAPQTCGTVLVGWNGNKAIFQVLCGYSFWESGGGGGYYDPNGVPGYGGAGSGPNGGGNSGSAPIAVDAPAEASPITCGDIAEVRQAQACYVAANNGIPAGPPGRFRVITIRWSTGTVETYVSTGAYTHGLWMVPVPGTCRDQ